MLTINSCILSKKVLTIVLISFLIETQTVLPAVTLTSAEFDICFSSALFIATLNWRIYCWILTDTLCWRTSVWARSFFRPTRFVVYTSGIEQKPISWSLWQHSGMILAIHQLPKVSSHCEEIYHQFMVQVVGMSRGPLQLRGSPHNLFDLTFSDAVWLYWTDSGLLSVAVAHVTRDVVCLTMIPVLVKNHRPFHISTSVLH